MTWIRMTIFISNTKAATQTAHPRRPKRHAAVGATTSIENHPVVGGESRCPVETKIN